MNSEEISKKINNLEDERTKILADVQELTREKKAKLVEEKDVKDINEKILRLTLRLDGLNLTLEGLHGEQKKVAEKEVLEKIWKRIHSIINEEKNEVRRLFDLLKILKPTVEKIDALHKERYLIFDGPPLNRRVTVPPMLLNVDWENFSTLRRYVESSYYRDLFVEISKIMENGRSWVICPFCLTAVGGEEHLRSLHQPLFHATEI